MKQVKLKYGYIFFSKNMLHSEEFSDKVKRGGRRMGLGDRLRKARELRGMAVKEIAKALNISPKTWYGWESGIRSPSPDMLHKIARILEVSVDYLLGLTDDPTPPQQLLPPWAVDLRAIPVYNGASAGDIGTFPNDNYIVMWITVPKQEPGKYGVIVHGDSMEPDISNGDVVIVDPNLPIDDGCEVVVIIDGEAYVKKIYFQDNVVILQSINSKKYPPMIIPRRKTDAYVVGRVAWVLKKRY